MPLLQELFTFNLDHYWEGFIGISYEEISYNIQKRMLC